MSKVATHLWHMSSNNVSRSWNKRFVVVSDSIICVYASRNDYESQNKPIHTIHLSADTQLIHESDSIVHQGYLIKKGKLKWNEKWCVLVNYGYLKYFNAKHGIRCIDFSKANFKLQTYGNLIYWLNGADRVYFRCDSPSIQKTWYKRMKSIQSNCMKIRNQYKNKQLLHKEPTLFAFTVDHKAGKDCFCAPSFFVLHLWNKCIIEQISRSDKVQELQQLSKPSNILNSIEIVTCFENDVTYIKNAETASDSYSARDESVNEKNGNKDNNNDNNFSSENSHSDDAADDNDESKNSNNCDEEMYPVRDRISDCNQETQQMNGAKVIAIEVIEPIYSLCQQLVDQIVDNIRHKYEHEHEEYGTFIENECDGSNIQTCNSLKRIILILNAYKQHIDSNKNNIVLCNYLNKTKSDLLNDYHHILDMHLNQDHIVSDVCNETFEWISNEILTTENVLSCDIKNCVIYKRHEMQRENAKVATYNEDDEYLSTYLDLLDSMHCYFLHDIKMSLKNKNCRFSNKFIIPNVQIEEHNIGHHFEHYWDEWEKPKYSTFKTELMNNNLYSLDLEAFNHVYKKSNYLLNNSRAIKKIRSSKQSKYGMEDELMLNISNILCISVYTDYDLLSYHFARTFYGDKRKESNDEYFHWSKLLCETVNGFGTRMDESKLSTLFIYCRFAHFTQFVMSLNAPISSTTVTALQSVQLQDANGIILALELTIERKSSKCLRYFNCSLFTNFVHENERLFINPPSIHNDHLLELVSIFNIASSANYKPFIEAWHTFNKFIDKQHVPNISPQSVLIINNLITHMHSKQALYPKPKYIYHSFKKWTDKKTQMVINLKMAKQFGISSLFYLHKKKLRLNLHYINVVFANMKWLICERVGEINEEFLSLLLQQINKINNLTHSHLNKIYLYDIPNIYEFAKTKTFIKYESLFTERKWTIRIKNGYCSDYLVVSK